MANKPTSFETFCKRTIIDAAKKLDSKSTEHLIRAFKAARCLDIYGGELHYYLAVIADRLETEVAKTKKYKAIILDIKRKAEAI